MIIGFFLEGIKTIFHKEWQIGNFCLCDSKSHFLPCFQSKGEGEEGEDADFWARFI